MLRVAAYCRVSTDQEDQANSFESQQRYFRGCIARNPDWVLQDIYADEGLSGTSTRKRKRFNAMIQAAREGKLDLILTKEVSRFARNTVDTLAYTRELRALGVGVLFLLDHINTLEADGELRLTIMASIAQEESRKTSERVKWGQQQRMAQGVVFGGPLLGYTVQGGRITLEPEGAKAVEAIFRKYLEEGKSAGTIARELQAEGVRSSRGNLSWSAATVLKILKNEKYCGDLVQKKTYTPDYLSHGKKYNRGQEELIVLRDHHAPIIDRETWAAVQREIARRRRSNPAEKGHGSRYPLSGKIFCGCCGSAFLARRKSSSAGVYRVWRCGKATREGRLRKDAQGRSLGCNVGCQLREADAMDILRQTVETLPLDRRAVIRSLAHVVEEALANTDGGRDLHRLSRELETLQKRKQQALEALFDQIITREEFRLMDQRYEEKVARLKEQMEALGTDRASGAQERARILSAVHGIVAGGTAGDAFYSRLLHCMTVHSGGRVEVRLAALPTRWIFALDDEVPAAQNDASVPISVSNPFSSGQGME